MRTLLPALTGMLVLALTSCADPAVTAAGGGLALTGRVLSAPSCPVERVGSPCPARPVAGALVTATGQAGKVVTRTDSDGRFSMSVRAGSYTVVATNPGGYASTASAIVTVTPTSLPLTLTVDSGIR